MSAPLLDTYDDIAHADVLLERFAAAIELLATRRPDLDEERKWLETARRRIAEARGRSADVLLNVLRLPELGALRGDHGRKLQSDAVDAVDGLMAAITKLNERSPLLDVIFRNLKTITARRLKRDDFDVFCKEVEGRLGSSYVHRMLSDESYEPVAPAVAKLHAAIASYRNVGTHEPLDPDVERALREELTEAGREVSIPVQQALLLAEAAFVRDPGLREESCIFERPKRRSPRRTEEPQLPLP